MKRIILLLFIMLILTGCSAEYNLIYEDNVFKENLILNSQKNDSFVNHINSNYNRNFFVNYKLQLGDMSEEEYILKYGGIYNKNIHDENGKYGLELSYNYDKEEDYLNSSIVFNIFDNFFIDGNIINATNIKNIFDNYNDLKEIKISFITDKKVININADKEIDGKYYWFINKDNYKDKEIKIKLEDIEEELITADGYLTGNVIKYILMLIAIIFLVSIIVLYEKVKKSNI